MRKNVTHSDLYLIRIIWQWYFSHELYFYTLLLHAKTGTRNTLLSCTAIYSMLNLWWVSEPPHCIDNSFRQALLLFMSQTNCKLSLNLIFKPIDWCALAIPQCFLISDTFEYCFDKISRVEWNCRLNMEEVSGAHTCDTVSRAPFADGMLCRLLPIHIRTGNFSMSLAASRKTLILLCFNLKVNVGKCFICIQCVFLIADIDIYFVG